MVDKVDKVDSDLKKTPKISSPKKPKTGFLELVLTWQSRGGPASLDPSRWIFPHSRSRFSCHPAASLG